MIKLRQPLQGVQASQKRKRAHLPGLSFVPPKKKLTLQEINISHLGKRKIIFKSAILGGYVIVPWRVYSFNQGGKVNNQQDLK